MLLVTTLQSLMEDAVSEDTHPLVIEDGEIRLDNDLAALSFLNSFNNAEMCCAHYRGTVVKVFS